MRVFLSIAAILLFSLAAFGQAQSNHAEVKPATASVKMPSEESAKLRALQEQADRLTSENAQTIAAYKDFTQRLTSIQAEAVVLVTRAALKAKLTIEQLDGSDLKWDEVTKSYEWRARPLPVSVTTPAAAPEKKN